LHPRSQLRDMMRLENKIAVALFYRGVTSHFEAMQSLDKIKREKPDYCQFESWSPFRFKVSLHETPLPSNQNHTIYSTLSPSCCSLTNSVEFMFPIAHNNLKFDNLYYRRAFVYHYRKHDMEEYLVSDSRMTLAAFEKDYEGNRLENQDDDENDG
jgi:tubulin alpha